MAITADLGGKSYTLPRGKLFFERFAEGIDIVATTRGDGERYFGNTPGFSVAFAAENLDHFSSEGGVREKDDSVQLTLNRTGKMECDNISDENLALAFLGESSTVSQSAATALQEVHEGALRGRFYQLGMSESMPAGVRQVANVVVKKGVSWVTTVAASGNYQVDLELGRVYVEDDAPDINDVDIQITYDTLASTRTQVVSGTNPVYGALRLVADNPKGQNRDYYLPYVKLAPDGDLLLKSEEWQKVGFTLEVLKKADNIQALYVDGRAVV
jgi:hypothetical protein